MNKKYLFLLTLLVTLALLLSACGGTDTSSTTKSSEEAGNQSSGNSDTDTAADQEESNGSSEVDSIEDAGEGGSESAQNSSSANPELSFAGQVPAPEFPEGLDWLNTSGPLKLADLRGKVVLLDFWTYGCINCMHIIPELKALEEKYADELVVIGVHSAKFENEGETDNIQRIIQRYELEHPVVNDQQFQVWSQYGARAWPTLVIIDPEGKVFGSHSGEDIYDRFDFVIGNMVAEFDEIGAIDRTPVSTILEKVPDVDSPLLFPGKVLVDADESRLFIADSNHNRIVITDLDGNVREVIGDGQPRLQDGDFESASFFRPQGMTLDDEGNLYVADTENNSIRLIDLDNRSVSTAAGTGEHMFMSYSEATENSPLNSPWDVLYHDGLVYIAMAGQHQIWTYDPDSGSLKVHAGSAREELKDGSLSQGGLNQPSGLSTDGAVLFIADSEASAIRTADIDPDGQLDTIVGTGLFDFGDVDGIGNAVRLQHPLDVVFYEDLLYVTDTYNSKIKVVDPSTRESTTFAGGTESGWQDGANALFDEPGGLSIGDGRLFIADTNNHVIRIADLETGNVSTLVLIDGEGLLTRQPAGAAYSGTVVEMDPQSVAAGDGSVSLTINLPDGYKVNGLAPFSMEWSSVGDVVSVEEEHASRYIVDPDFPITFPVDFHEGEGALTGDLVVYFCESVSQSLCLIERVRITAPLVVGDSGGNVVLIDYTIPDPPA
ncbi:MAG TPA: thioredoxin-like domain-containing protein [candidate division Zixibacteria bacterium]|nr:thioredoxin-like domain-containing protein [candidate division Zixibacteria bacterium]